MDYLDGFTGYGGFRLGFERAGWNFDNVYFSEIDKYAIANYRHNFKNSIYVGSITDVHRCEAIPNIDLFTFGWPCQDNSIAGKRKGQRTGTRSGLLYEATRIINEFKPRNFVAENVLGLLSVNKGVDIIESLEVLAYLDESCPQYDIEMQLLNTRWVLPQNRERLFFVGHLRGSGSRQIFPIGETGFSNVAKGGYTKEGVACTLGTRSAKSRLGADYTIIAQRGRNGVQELEPSKGDYTNTLTSVKKDNYLFDGTTFRDLTPIEYERLQGLPDNWTRFGDFNGVIKEISDTQRYHMGGNGVSVPIIELIAGNLICN